MTSSLGKRELVSWLQQESGITADMLTEALALEGQQLVSGVETDVLAKLIVSATKRAIHLHPATGGPVDVVQPIFAGGQPGDPWHVMVSQARKVKLLTDGDTMHRLLPSSERLQKRGRGDAGGSAAPTRIKLENRKQSTFKRLSPFK